jgi:hypothetical protein
MERTVTRDHNHHRAHTSFPPRRINITYLVTAWARKVEDEHQLLWRALAALKATPKVAPEECEGFLRYQQHDIPLLVADMSDQPTNLVDLWGVLDNQMRVGFTLIATVELDTEIGFEAPLVLEAAFKVGQSESPPDELLTALDVEIQHRADENHKEDE